MPRIKFIITLTFFLTIGFNVLGQNHAVFNSQNKSFIIKDKNNKQIGTLDFNSINITSILTEIKNSSEVEHGTRLARIIEMQSSKEAKLYELVNLAKTHKEISKILDKNICEQYEKEKN